jgi:predicted SnoaL-like aldol condensation-catalyzing enzyme
MSNRKHAAQNFLHMSATGDVRRAYEKYVANNFVHHNPHFAADAKSLADAMEQNAHQNPHKTIDTIHTIEEGDLVAVHSRVRMSPDAADIALVHIFRFEGERVVELWDISQAAPEDSPNRRGMF